MFRIGNGYDVHKFAENRELILGGVKIPYEKGLLGHSDADVLIHAIMDALLGALALKDIGHHFPDTDNNYKGISSLKLLKKVTEIVKEKGYDIENVDSIVVMQKPKIKDFIDRMRETMAITMEIAVDNISVKATTEEKLGFTGNEEGVKSYAVVLLRKAEKI